MAPAKLPPPPAKIIGLCYGTFDLLHDGHLYLLRRARWGCDQLIVAIDSDRFAARRKGPGRPVEDAAVRSHKLIQTGLPAFVIAVDSAAQLADALDFYEPDRLFAGDDGSLLNQFLKDHYGVDITLFPLLPGHSTASQIKARLQ
jgi:D-beta-D-heptose 7-phosphate kinase / D-beta-D-heptose 1-phosphate adenosyltransferase